MSPSVSQAWTPSLTTGDDETRTATPWRRAYSPSPTSSPLPLSWQWARPTVSLWPSCGGIRTRPLRAAPESSSCRLRGTCSARRYLEGLTFQIPRWSALQHATYGDLSARSGWRPRLSAVPLGFLCSRENRNADLLKC